MGINGLLPLLKSIHKSCNLKKFEGKTLGVDAYGWLHRGTVACAMELATGKPTRKFVDFAMHRVRMLQHYGVTPYLIFDGDYLPSKAATETDRAKRREDAKKSGFELMKAGKTSQAYLEFQKAVDVTPEMARQLIDELKKTGVQYIVAPYEADAQMVYLERKGVIDGIISEDSDLLVFGAKCLLTKLDQYGNCIEVNKADFSACKEITLTGWSDKEFRYMAILSGCDYLASINNMGLKTAYRMVRKHKTIEKVIRMLQFDGKFHVPKGYLEAFQQAEFTFLHQRVFCPRTRSLVLHTEPEQVIDLDNMLYIGAHVEPRIAQGVARGDLNPMTKLPIIAATNRHATSTPWNPRPQKHQLSLSSDMKKKGVSLETFFKSNRTPLGELDPNCFTPSPSQQQALQRNSGPWVSPPILMPRPYLDSPTAVSNQLPHSAPQPLRTQGRTAPQPNLSEPRPVKRARLCEDEESVVSPNRKVELGLSRFFGSETPGPSPSVGRKTKGKKSKNQDVYIFSDDSIEEAMLGLPDADGFVPVPRKKVPIFQEDRKHTEELKKETISSQDLELELMDTQGTVPSLTDETSTATSAEQPPTPTERSSLPSFREKITTQFTFGTISTPKPVAAINRNPTSPSSAATKPSRIPLAVHSHSAISKTFSTKPFFSPLQRLGASATNRSRLPMTPPETPILLTKTQAPRRSLLSKGSVPFPEVVGQITTRIVDSASIPLPTADDVENAALRMGGSEDLIIPDSEGEDEALSPGPSGLNLGQFTYAAR